MLCCRVQNLLSAYSDQELTGAEMQAIRRHLDACAACRREYEGVGRMKSLLRGLAAVEPEQPFTPELYRNRPRPMPRPLQVLAGLLAVCSPAVLMRRPDLRLLCAGSAAICALLLALVAQPQAPDAVSAHVPELVPEESVALASGYFSSEPLPYSAVFLSGSPAGRAVAFGEPVEFPLRFRPRRQAPMSLVYYGADWDRNR